MSFKSLAIVPLKFKVHIISRGLPCLSQVLSLKTASWKLKYIFLVDKSLNSEMSLPFKSGEKSYFDIFNSDSGKLSIRFIKPAIVVLPI